MLELGQSHSKVKKMYQYNGVAIPNSGMTINGYTVTPIFLDQRPDLVEAWGITQIVAPSHPDPSLYSWVVNADGSYTTTPLPLAVVKADRIQKLSSACQAAIYAGFTSSALGEVYSYPFGDLDQTNLTGSVLLSTLPSASAAGWTTAFLCENSIGVWAYRPHTQAQIQQVGQDAANTKLAHLVNNATKAAQINAIQASENPLADNEAVCAIVF